jgi:hypothetical protein
MGGGENQKKKKKKQLNFQKMHEPQIICMKSGNGFYRVGEGHLVTQSLDVRPCLRVDFVHGLPAELQKRRAVAVEFVQLVHCERLLRRCNQSNTTQSVTRKTSK